MATKRAEMGMLILTIFVIMTMLIFVAITNPKSPPGSGLARPAMAASVLSMPFTAVPLLFLLFIVKLRVAMESDTQLNHLVYHLLLVLGVSGTVFANYHLLIAGRRILYAA